MLVIVYAVELERCPTFFAPQMEFIYELNSILVFTF